MSEKHGSLQGIKNVSFAYYKMGSKNPYYEINKEKLRGYAQNIYYSKNGKEKSRCY